MNREQLLAWAAEAETNDRPAAAEYFRLLARIETDA